jgi:cytochrome c biogenesis protein CcmG/thiol:disulfide interchange protein DsbE
MAEPDTGPVTETDTGPVTEPETEPEPGSVAGGSEPVTGLGPARLTSIVVGVVVTALVVLFAFGRGDQPDGVTQLLGNRTPPVAGSTLDGDSFDGPPFDIDDHRGSWVIVNFFASWCAPCVAEHPELVELEAWGSERGDVELVSVVFQDPPDRVAQFFAERGGTWPVLDNPVVPVAFHVSQIPETFLVSPAGQVLLHVESQISAAEVKRLIEEIEE